MRERPRNATLCEEATMPFYEKGGCPHPLRRGWLGFPVDDHPRRRAELPAGHVSPPFNPMEEFKDEYRCIAADLRQHQRRPIHWPAGDRPPLGRLHRRPPRPDGSPGHLGVPGTRLLHRRPLHLEPVPAGAPADRRGRAGPAQRLPSGAAGPLLPKTTLRAGARRSARAGRRHHGHGA